MKRIILLAALSIAGASLSARPIIYKVGPFDQLSLTGNIDIIYSSLPDSIGMAAYDSSEDYSEAIEITNNKGHLNIKEKPGHDMGKMPKIRVYSDYLSKVNNEGNAEITVNLSAATPTFSASLVGNGCIICDGIKATDVSASITTGNGTIVLRGKCTDANFKLTGTGVIQADDLEARNVKCFALGTGTIGCHPSEKLDVRGVGSTKIYYLGDPEIKKVGGAKLIRMTAPEAEVMTGEAEQSSGDEEDETEEKIVVEESDGAMVVEETEGATVVDATEGATVVEESEEETFVEESEEESFVEESEEETFVEVVDSGLNLW